MKFLIVKHRNQHYCDKKKGMCVKSTIKSNNKKQTKDTQEDTLAFSNTIPFPKTRVFFLINLSAKDQIRDPMIITTAYK